MSVGFGQMLIIVLLALLLLGKFPNIKDDLMKGVTNFLDLMSKTKAHSKDTPRIDKDSHSVEQEKKDK